MRGIGMVAAMVGLALLLAGPAAAQDTTAAQSARPIAVDFTLAPAAAKDIPADPVPGDEAETDRIVADYLRQRDAARQTECHSDADMLVAGAAGRPRYDENGALIREPASGCGEPYSRTQAAATAASPRDSGLIVERESGGSCTEDRLTGTRTCTSSGSITVGNSAEGNERTRQAVDDLLDNLSRD